MKKKFISFVMAFMLLLVGGFTLAGCDEVPADPTTPPAGETEPTHTHEYVGDPYYEISNGKAYSYTFCDCGEKSENQEVENAIIVSANPTDENYVQKVLDGNISNKTIVFSAGEYNEKMLFRPALNDETKAYVLVAGEEYGDEVALNNLDPSAKYEYVRQIENVKFVAVENAVLKEDISFHAESINERYDAVRNITTTNATRYYEEFKVKNLTFSRLNLNGEAAGILFSCQSMYSENNKFENIEINNCKFNAETNSTSSECAIKFQNNFASKVEGRYYYENITVRDNEIKGYYQGVIVLNAKNVSVLNNSISNTYHNAIAVQSSAYNSQPAYADIPGGKFTGEIVISGNSVKNVVGEAAGDGTFKGDRAIRFGTAKQATILVENNTFENAIEKSNGNVLKMVALTDDWSFTFRNNMYESNKLKDKVVTEDATDVVVLYNDIAE